MHKQYKVSIIIPAEIAKYIKDVLEIEEGCCPDFDEDAVIYTATARFPNGYEADIKLCNGDTPWVDPVLFDESGRQEALLDPDEDFFGEFRFEAGDGEYIVDVKEGDKKYVKEVKITSFRPNDPMRKCYEEGLCREVLVGFDDSRFARVAIYNEAPMRVRAFLHEESGELIASLERNSLAGKYVFKTDGTEYVIIVTS